MKMQKDLDIVMNGSQRQNHNNVGVQERVNTNVDVIDRNDEEVHVDDAMYKILLMNNEDTSVEAVLDVLEGVFQHDPDTCVKIMMDAHNNGHAIVWIDARTQCEEKIREAQIYCGQLAGETIEGCTLDDGNNRPHYYQALEFRMELFEEEV